MKPMNYPNYLFDCSSHQSADIANEINSYDYEGMERNSLMRILEGKKEEHVSTNHKNVSTFCNFFQVYLFAAVVFHKQISIP